MCISHPSSRWAMVRVRSPLPTVLFNERRSRLGAGTHYDRAYEWMMSAQPPRIKDSAHVLNSIGVLQDRRGRYDNALEYYQRVLSIQETYHRADDPDVARTLDNIGLILHSQGHFDHARFDYKKKLIRLAMLPSL